MSSWELKETVEVGGKEFYFRYATYYYVEFKFMACLLIFFIEQIRITDLQYANEYKSHSKFKREM